MSFCEYQLYPADFLYGPAEFCENEAIEDEDYCEEHMPTEPDPDDARDRRRGL